MDNEYVCLIGFWIIGMAFYVACVVWAYKIGKKKGRPGMGLLLGFLLGWIGVIIMYFAIKDESGALASSGSAATTTDPSCAHTSSYRSTSSKKTVTCKHCSRQAPADGRFCPYCGHQL